MSQNNELFWPSYEVLIPVMGWEKQFSVHRIYCVGRNYTEHAKEMGVDPRTSSPMFFSKPADAIVVAAGNECKIPYPLKTNNLHHEVELVVALSSGGENLSVAEAAKCIFGYAVGVDLTRRDLQAEAKQKGAPWDTAKGFDNSAPISNIIKNNAVLAEGKITLSVNGALRQSGNIKDMIWNVPHIIASLSSYYKLRAGDLIYTGTPEGVGAINKGDKIVAEMENIDALTFTLI